MDGGRAGGAADARGAGRAGQLGRQGPRDVHGASVCCVSAVAAVELSLSKSCWLSQHRTGNSVEAQYYKCVVHKQPLRKGGRPAPPLKYEYELEVSRQHPTAACCVWTIGGLSCCCFAQMEEPSEEAVEPDNLPVPLPLEDVGGLSLFAGSRHDADQAAPKESEEFLNRQVRRHIYDQSPSCTPRAQPPCCLNYPNRLNADRWLVLQRAKEAAAAAAKEIASRQPARWTADIDEDMLVPIPDGPPLGRDEEPAPMPVPRAQPPAACKPQRSPPPARRRSPSTVRCCSRSQHAHLRLL